jgi:hypothetical protein
MMGTKATTFLIDGRICSIQVPGTGSEAVEWADQRVAIHLARAECRAEMGKAIGMGMRGVAGIAPEQHAPVRTPGTEGLAAQLHAGQDDVPMVFRQMHGLLSKASDIIGHRVSSAQRPRRVLEAAIGTRVLPRPEVAEKTMDCTVDRCRFLASTIHYPLPQILPALTQEEHHVSC